VSEELKGEELKQRAKDLEIEGRSDLSADELRDAVAKAEVTDGLDDLEVDLYPNDPAYVFVSLGGERRRCRYDDINRARKKFDAAAQSSY
jgi:hypothetical protein